MTEVAQVEVQSAWLSKINWGEIVKVVAALAATKGVNLTPDVQNDILMAIIGIGGVYTFVIKTWFTKTITPASASGPDVPTKTIAKVLLFAFALSLFLPRGAVAGDIASPVAAINKAVTVPAPCQVATATTPLSCSGFYVGVGISGQGSNADIIGSGINGSVFAGGIVPSFNAGYQYVQGNWLFGVEYDLGYSINNTAQVNGVGNNYNGLRMSEVFKFGGNAAALLGTQQPITIPASLANAVIAPYAHVSPTQWQLPGAWANGTGSGVGAEFDFGPRIWGDLRYTYTDFNGAKANGVTIQNDQSLRFSVNYKLN